jgi:predicted HTH domain antitoxin
MSKEVKELEEELITTKKEIWEELKIGLSKEDIIELMKIVELRELNRNLVQIFNFISNK